MQIILTQNDIEVALKNYVNELVNIKDGHVITVELKATRGENGATAVIDIMPLEKGEATVAKPEVATKRAAVAETVKEPVKKPALVVEEEQEQKAPEEDPVVEEPEVEETPVTTPVVKKSLFGNIKNDSEAQG